MNIQIDKSSIKKHSALTITGSKSESNRLLLLQALFPNIDIQNISNADDAVLMQNALRLDSSTIDIHHAGTAMRFLTAFLSTQEGREITSLEVEPRVRVNDKFRIIFSTSFDILNNDIGFVSQALYPESIDGLSAGDIMMGRRDRQIVTNSINTRFIFTNNMFIEGRIRHYWDKVGYDGFFRLKEDGGLALLNFDGEDDGVAVYDRNVNFFNVDLNYTWRFAPGSDIIFNWKQSIFGEDRDLDNQYFANLGNLFSKSQENSISVKVIYFLDYNSLING